MSDPYLAEIRMFAGNFAPAGWALCSGQLMPVQQNTALFSLLGITYGGTGVTTFGLPDLRGSVPLQQGQGPGLSQRYLGEQAGVAAVTLLGTELPRHTHVATARAGSGNTNQPGGAVWAQAMYGRHADAVYSTAPPNTQLNPLAASPAGGNQPHNNMPPYLCVTFIIALQGEFPQRP